MKAAATILFLVLILLSAGCTATAEPDMLDSSDAGRIYAAAIRQIYNVDHSFGQPPGWPALYLLSATDDGVMPGAPAAASHQLPASLQQTIAAELADQPFELIWVNSMDEVPVDPNNGEIAEGQGIVITLGNVHVQDDGTVQLSFFMVCGGLCGIGKIYVLSVVNGTWQVTGSVGPEIMS